MAEFESIREIAARLVADYHRKHPGHPHISGMERDAVVEALKIPVPVVEAAIRMEALNEKDRNWLERIGIKV